MIPVLALGGLAVVGVARAAFRASTRLSKLPPAMFGVVDPRQPSPFLKGGFRSEMDVHEARQILDLPQKFTTQDLQQAHRKALLSNHPDRGGSTFLAQKINQAKRLLTNGSK